MSSFSTAGHSIIDNGLQPGNSLLSDNELSKQLNVSRNLVREAIRGLEALGIIDIQDEDPFWTYELHIPIVESFVKGDVEATRNALQ